MKVFRLTRKKYAGTLSGVGFSIKGGRWNSVGTELIYTGENRSLAMAEIAVHFSIGTMPNDYVMLTIYFPDKLKVKTITVDELPEDWNAFPATRRTQHIGDDFVFENKFPICKIPSVVTQGDFNYLINPRHPDFHLFEIVETVDFALDKRIFK